MFFQNKLSTVKKAGISYVFANLILKLTVVFSTPVFARMLSVEEFGKVSLFTSWKGILIAIFSLQLYTSIARAKFDFKDEIDHYIRSIKFLALLNSCAICIAILVGFNLVKSILKLDKISVIILSIVLIGDTLVELQQTDYRYRYNYKKNIRIAIGISLSGVMCSLILLFLSENKYYARIVGMSIPSIVMGIVLTWNGFKTKQFKIHKIYWRYALSISIPLVFHAIGMNILAQSDRLVIAKYISEEAVGKYSVAYQYAILIQILLNAINNAWIPWFHENFAEEHMKEIEKSAYKIMILCCVGGILSVAVAPLGIWLIGGTKYTESKIIVAPIVLSVICQTFYSFFVVIETHKKKTKWIAFATLIAAVLNIVLNILFIPTYGYQAAAYTTLLCYFALALGHFIIVRKILKVKLYHFGYMVSLLILSAIAMSLVVKSYI